jgi:hypothetical protein
MTALRHDGAHRPAEDGELLARQASLQAEAAAVLADLDLAAIVADIGPMLPTGSYVSGLMCWRELDVMVHVGAEFSPRHVLGLLERIVDRPGVVGLDYHDERGPRSPTGTDRDERYHVVVALSRAGQEWRLDLTLWLNDLHRNITAWHETLRDTVTDEQRRAILRIKDVWHRLPSYPDSVGGQQIYTAVLEDEVRTPTQFAAWLAGHGYPATA